MRAHPSDVHVQHQGCQAVSHLSASGTFSQHFLFPTKAGETNKTIGQLGGADVVLNAMRIHPSSQELQTTACEALVQLCFNNSTIIIVHSFNFSGETARAVGERGGIDVILQAMRTHQGVESVQRHGCQALIHTCSYGRCALFQTFK